ncbi:hypothetical protein [Candidatus Nitrospira bockiana]
MNWIPDLLPVRAGPGEARPPRAKTCRRGFALALVFSCWAVLIATGSVLAQAPAAEPVLRPALQGLRLGLYHPDELRLTGGQCGNCPISAATLWYVRDQTLAVPRAASYDSPVIWVGAAEVLEHVRLFTDGEIPVMLVPRTGDSETEFDDASARYFLGRPLRLRGTLWFREASPLFVARTIWPEDFRIVPERLRLEPLRDARELDALIMAQMESVPDPYMRLLWERRPGEPRRWLNRPVLAFVLNGAQADDDDAHAGHMSVATGYLGPAGEWADWLVNNFYPLDKVDSKGIVSAIVPMDNYLMDVNSGQAYYRPNYLAVAVLREDRAPRLFQRRIEDVFYHYYCHNLEYDVATMNSTSIPIDTLRQMGWNIPSLGRSGIFKALLGFVYVSLTQGNVSQGRQFYNAFIEEKTRLSPRLAFQAATLDLLRLAERAVPQDRTLTAYEEMLRDDLEAVLFLRIPQVPSRRPFGTYPVTSFEEYLERLPDDPSRWKRTTDPVRPFPKHLAEQCNTPSGPR